MSQKYQKIVATLAPGIYRLKSGGFRVRVAVGQSKRGGQQRDTTFPKGTALRKMKAWQTQQRATLMRLRIVPATGTLDADIPRYLDTLERTARLNSDRTYQLEAWKDRFGARRRHTIARPEVQQLVTEWVQDGVAASTIRHRLTALSKVYERLDGKDGENPVKGVERPREPEPQPDARPVEMIERVLDALWYRTAMNNRGWKTLARAHVARFNPYKLRHSFATLLRREGADLADVQALLGHKSPKTTARYADVSKEKLAAAVQRLERGWNTTHGDRPSYTGTVAGR